ncbi:MAG TPA: undecaprenyl-diphosphate phosphatase [Steroidobacteraceae bacterium]
MWSSPKNCWALTHLRHPMTLLLVMLHTGTMFAVIVYFWRQWRDAYFQSIRVFKAFAVELLVATAITGVVGESIAKLVELTVLRDSTQAEIEMLFSRLDFIAPALAASGLLILLAGIFERRKSMPQSPSAMPDLTMKRASAIGLVQGFCLPFRGFSRSGATISTGMLLGVAKSRAEAFSFALAVILTPPVVFHEVTRLIQAEHDHNNPDLTSVAYISLLGALIAFAAGLLALKWLSRWLENGRWYLFGIYCLVAAVTVRFLHQLGY